MSQQPYQHPYWYPQQPQPQPQHQQLQRHQRQRQLPFPPVPQPIVPQGSRSAGEFRDDVHRWQCKGGGWAERTCDALNGTNQVICGDCEKPRGPADVVRDRSNMIGYFNDDGSITYFEEIAALSTPHPLQGRPLPQPPTPQLPPMPRVTMRDFLETGTAEEWGERSRWPNPGWDVVQALRNPDPDWDDVVQGVQNLNVNVGQPKDHGPMGYVEGEVEPDGYIKKEDGLEEYIKPEDDLKGYIKTGDAPEGYTNIIGEPHRWVTPPKQFASSSGNRSGRGSGSGRSGSKSSGGRSGKGGSGCSSNSSGRRHKQQDDQTTRKVKRESDKLLMPPPDRSRSRK